MSSDQALMAQADGLLRRSLRAAHALDEPAVPVDIQIDPDPSVGSFQILAVSPLGALDRQVVLAAPGLRDRLGLLAELLADAAELLEARASMI